MAAWYWVVVVHVPAHTAGALRVGRPLGNLSDLYPRWLGARELLLHGRDPYGDDITREIQTGFYGRTLDPSRPFDPKDQEGFAYPIYVVFILAPLLRLPFADAQAVFRAVLWLTTALSVPLWLYALGLRRSWSFVAAATLLMLSSYAFVQAVYLQQFTLIVNFLLAASFALVVAERWIPAGILLALATIKPHLAALPVLCLLLWVCGDWRRRKILLVSFAGSMAVLLAASQILLAGWIPEFLAAVRSYQHYAFTPTILEAVLGTLIGKLLGVAAVLGYAALAWHWRKVPAGSTAFAVQPALALTVTLLLVPNQAPYNYVLMFPAVAILVRCKDEIWRMGVAARAVYRACVVCLAWYWIAALASTILSLVSRATARRFPDAPFYTFYASLLLAAAILAIVAATSFRSQRHTRALAETVP